MRLTPRQRVSWAAHLFKAAFRQHHRELVPVLAPYVPAEGVVIDVGAHAGQFSKLFARLAPQGRIYAIEPSSYARSILRPALAVARVSNVTVVAAGLSDRPGQALLHTPLKRSSALGFGLAHLGAAGVAGLDQTVAVTTLDEFTVREGLARLDLIKADIEGWEMRALVGGEASLRRFRPALFLEIDAGLMMRAGDTPQALFEWLANLGYRALVAPGNTPGSEWTGPGDYLFASAERS